MDLTLNKPMRVRPAPVTRGRPRPAPMTNWLRAQALNITRHSKALRPFRSDEFGAGPEAPTEGHIEATNALMEELRGELRAATRQVVRASAAALRQPDTPQLQALMRLKERAHNQVRAIERIWDFYFELFGQRQSIVGPWLLSCDRIALDCYQHSYVNLQRARSIPAPPAFCYMRTGFSPATFRRGIALRKLGRQPNPFPLIQLPYHRLVNPWTLGAVLHEVSHNLQNDLGLDRVLPRAIAAHLLAAGYGHEVALVWTRWNREFFADLSALLLGGPAVVASLLDVIGRSPETVFAYAAGAPHPTPYIRAFISFELLRRIGFPEQARAYQRMWSRIYPQSQRGSIPHAVLSTFQEVVPLVVDTVCYRRYPSLGDTCLANVMRFAPKEQQMVEEAGQRLARGTDPGVIPARFLIGAARFALDAGLARPERITKNFYRELARR